MVACTSTVNDTCSKNFNVGATLERWVTGRLDSPCPPGRACVAGVVDAACRSVTVMVCGGVHIR